MSVCPKCLYITVSACWLYIPVLYVSVFLCASVSVSQSVCSSVFVPVSVYLSLGEKNVCMSWCQCIPMSVSSSVMCPSICACPNDCIFQCLCQCLYVPVFVCSRDCVFQSNHVAVCLRVLVFGVP